MSQRNTTYRNTSCWVCFNAPEYQTSRSTSIYTKQTNDLRARYAFVTCDIKCYSCTNDHITLPMYTGLDHGPCTRAVFIGCV